MFDSVCSACHAPREFTGRIFEITWMAEPVGHFFEHISTAMPQDDPGSLAPQDYAAVLAYVLRLNQVPPGNLELPADPVALSHIRWRP